MSTNFEYKEEDKEGLVTLDVVSQATHFNRWMFDTIKPFCEGKILEVGSGIGNISTYFVNEGYDLVLSDIRPKYCETLKSKFPNQIVRQIDLVDDAFDQNNKDLFGCFDTVFALNVIEHIEDDQLAMTNLLKLLKSQGNFIILVPAFQALYNSFDRALYHYRRYTKKSLRTLFENQFTIRDLFYFNPVGIIGWYVNGSLLKKQTIPEDQMKQFDRLVPIFKLINYFTKPLFGLSVVGVATKS